MGFNPFSGGQIIPLKDPTLRIIFYLYIEIEIYHYL